MNLEKLSIYELLDLTAEMVDAEERAKTEHGKELARTAQDLIAIELEKKYKASENNVL